MSDAENGITWSPIDFFYTKDVWLAGWNAWYGLCSEWTALTQRRLLSSTFHDPLQMHHKAIFPFISHMPYRPRNFAHEEPWVNWNQSWNKNKRAVLRFPTTHLWGLSRNDGSMFVLLTFHNNSVLQTTKHFHSINIGAVRDWIIKLHKAPYTDIVSLAM